MPKITFKGQLPIDVEEKIHLSTNDGLTGYRINKFQIMSSNPGNGSHELVGKIRLTADPNVGPTVNLSDPDVLAACYHTDLGNANVATSDSIILDQETFNQNIFVQIGDATGGTSPANFYIELEKFKLDLNTSTFHTLKNIRSRTQ
jgi:hypothetical protein